MIIKRIILGSLSLLLANSTLAGTMGQVTNSWLPVMSLSLGPAWSDAGKTQTFYLQPDVEKTYSANKKNKVLLSGEFFLGGQHLITNNLYGQLGLAIAGAGSAKLQGDIWEDADPDFNNFFYQYKVNHLGLALKGKLFADLGYFVQPFISGSAGLGFNQARGFKIRPKIFEEIPAPGFAGHTETAFSYTIGAGVQKALNEQWQVGLGYEFADWGKSHLAKASGQSLNEGLCLNHLYTNGLQLSLSYLA